MKVCQRARGSSAVPGGFLGYALVERSLRQVIGERTERRERSESPQRSTKEPIFVENTGACSLFSITKAEQLYRDGEAQFGRDNMQYARGRIADAVRQGNRRAAAGAPAADSLAELCQRFPNAAEVIDEVERAAALAKWSPINLFQLPPLLLLGEPGLGKTAFLQALAGLLQVPFRRIDIGTLSTGAEIFGTSLSWSTGRTGEIFNLLASSPVANPILLLDEIDKAAGNHQAPVIPALLSLLEGESARDFRDEAVALPMDASRINWVAAANDAAGLPSHLMSRFLPIIIRRPTGDDAVQVALSIYRSLRERNAWGFRFPDCPDRAVVDGLVRYTPRQMSLILRRAFGEAARAGRCRIAASDLNLPEVKQRQGIGFLQHAAP